MDWSYYRHLPMALVIIGCAIVLAIFIAQIMVRKTFGDKRPIVTQLFPRPRKNKTHVHRWRVDYDCTYDGGSTEWSGYYHFRTWAIICAWWNCHISAWTGTAMLHDQRRETSK